MLSKAKLLSLSLVLLPVVSLAAGTFDQAGYFSGMAQTFKDVINILIPAFMGLGFIAFFYFLFTYILSKSEDKSKQKEGLMWSVIAIVIMISIYGLANLLQGIFGAEGTVAPIVPTFQ